MTILIMERLIKYIFLLSLLLFVLSGCYPVYVDSGSLLYYSDGNGLLLPIQRTVYIDRGGCLEVVDVFEGVLP